MSLVAHKLVLFIQEAIQHIQHLKANGAQGHFMVLPCGYLEPEGIRLGITFKGEGIPDDLSLESDLIFTSEEDFNKTSEVVANALASALNGKRVQ